jgi:hypothetical protein
MMWATIGSRREGGGGDKIQVQVEERLQNEKRNWTATKKKKIENATKRQMQN